SDEGVSVFQFINGTPCFIGGFTPGGTKCWVPIEATQDCSVLSAQLTARLSFIVSLINEPRAVDRTPASGMDWTRQHRRAVERVTGKAAQAYTVVGWEIGRPVAAKVGQITTDGHKKALHWCRAHWAKAAEGEPKAEWVNIPRKGGWGWYRWVKDCWKGHPDYGIKLQRHEPHMPGDPKSLHVGVGSEVVDQMRLAAMSAMQRHSLVEAGFAASVTLH
ncbi:hypothetical protein, partial [Paracoccus simplex]